MHRIPANLESVESVARERDRSLDRIEIMRLKLEVLFLVVGSFDVPSCVGIRNGDRERFFLGFKYETGQRLFDTFHESESVDDESAD